MLNREWKTVTVKTYSTTIDAYGQKKTGVSSSRNIQMVVKEYKNSNTDDIRYNNVTKLGITKDLTLTDTNEIVIDNVIYYILYVLPSGKYLQVLMGRK